MTQRTAPVVAIVYGVVDSEGILDYAVTEDEHQEIFIDAIDDEGQSNFFEAEAYRLAEWCKAKGFRYYRGQIEIDVDLEEEIF